MKKITPFRTMYDVCIPDSIMKKLYTVQGGLQRSDIKIVLNLLQKGGAGKHKKSSSVPQFAEGADKHTVSSSIPQFAADCGLGAEVARRSLLRLERLGVIQRGERKQGEHAPSEITLICGADEHYTKIPKETFCALMDSNLYTTALKLWLFIARNIYGYKEKKQKCTSLFSYSFIERGCGINHRNIGRALAELTAAKAIEVSKNEQWLKGYGYETSSIKLTGSIHDVTHIPRKNEPKSDVTNTNYSCNVRETCVHCTGDDTCIVRVTENAEKKPTKADEHKVNEENQTIVHPYNARNNISKFTDFLFTDDLFTDGHFEKCPPASPNAERKIDSENEAHTENEAHEPKTALELIAESTPEQLQAMNDCIEAERRSTIDIRSLREEQKAVTYDMDSMLRYSSRYGSLNGFETWYQSQRAATM